LYTCNPTAGLGMLFRWAVLMRGNKNPRAVSANSKMAELSGCPPAVEINTPCAFALRTQTTEKNKKRNVLAIKSRLPI
jgi:hypothetical protein